MWSCLLATIAIGTTAVPAVAMQDSTRGRVTATAFIVGPTETVAISVAYFRPMRDSRPVLGDLVPFDTPWITGSTFATELTCPRAFVIGALNVPAGTFSLWTVPTKSGTTLIVNRRVGAGAQAYDSTQDVGRVPLAAEVVAQPVEPFAIFFRGERKAPDTLTWQYDTRQSAAMHGDHYTIGVGSGTSQKLVIAWERFRWTVPVHLQQ